MEPKLAPDLLTRTADGLQQLAGVFTWEHLPFLFLALIPALIWLYVMLRHQMENKFLTFLTFCAGGFAVVPIWIFQVEIDRIRVGVESAGLIAFATITLTSLWVGFYEETAKHWVVKVTDRDFFQSIDDAIEFSIIAALGFAFVENIVYLNTIWNIYGIHGFEFARFFLLRAGLSVGLHVIASGIFGYYYGIAHFAQPILQEELRLGNRFPIIGKIHQLLHFKSETLFHEEKILEGLLIAAGIHGLFDFLMGYSEHLNQTNNPFLANLLIVANVPLIVGGFIWLTSLLDKKEDHKEYGKLIEGERTSG